MTATVPTRADAADPGTLPFLSRLALRRIEPLIFRSTPAAGGPPRLFGGEVAAQAVMAAVATVDADRHLHAVQAQYLRPGDPAIPVVFHVQVSMDGGSFSTRSIEATQGGRQIFGMIASFQRDQDGVAHQWHGACPGIDLPAPDDCGPGDPLQRGWADGVMSRLPVDIRFAEDGPTLDPVLGVAPRLRAYVRTRERLPDDRAVHAAGVAYLSDLLMISAALLPHELSIHDPRLLTATIGHSLWLHAPVRADEWLLYDVEGTWAGGGRSLSHGRMYDADGFLRASSAQEGLVRYRPAG